MSSCVKCGSRSNKRSSWGLSIHLVSEVIGNFVGSSSRGVLGGEAGVCAGRELGTSDGQR